MSSERKRMQEIFLDELNNDFSDESALASIEKCDAILRKKFEGKEHQINPEIYLEHFFDEKDDTFVYNDNAIELFDLWDVFNEFYEIFARLNANPDLIILQTILQIEFMNTQFELEALKKNTSEQFCKTIEDMTKFIVELKDKKMMTIHVLIPGESWASKDYPFDIVVKEPECEAIVIEHALLKVAGKIVLIEILFSSKDKVSMAMKEDGWEFIKTVNGTRSGD